MPTDPNQLKLAKELSRKEILLCIARVPNSNRVFVGCSDGKIFDVDVLAEKPEFQELAGHTSYVTGLALAGKTLVSGSYDGHLIWWDSETRQQIRNVEAHAKWIRRVTATVDGRLVASIADDMVCRVWDAESGQIRFELRGHDVKTPHHFPSMLYACAFSADGTRLATGDKVGRVVVWDTSSGQQVATLAVPEMYTWDPKQRIHSIGGLRSLAFSPDGKLLAAGGMGQVGNIDHLEGKSRVEIFDWQKGERTHEIPGDQFKGLVERLTFHTDGSWLLAAGGDNGGFLQFIDPATGKFIKQEKAPSHIHDFVLNETCDAIYAAAHGRVLMWTMTAATS